MTRIVEDLTEIAIRRKINPLEFVRQTFKSDIDLSTTDEKYIKHKQETIPEGFDKNNLDFFYQIDHYISSRKKKVSKEMPRIFKNMRDHMGAFEKFRGAPITFECLDIIFYEELVDFLTFDYVQPRTKKIGLRINSIGKTIRLLRTFLRNRIRRKIIEEINMEGWNIVSEETDAIYFTSPEIAAIYNADLSEHPHLVPYRNDLVFSCLTGLRFSDFSNLDLDSKCFH